MKLEGAASSGEPADVPARGRTAAAEAGEGRELRPRVIVDFEVDDDDVLMIAIRNIGDLPAARVRVRFRPWFRGLGGEKLIPRLSVFRRLSFLSPGREIRVLVDSIAHYLGRCEPEEPRVIHAAIRYRDLNGRRYRTRMRHDLGIWDDLPRKKARSHGDGT